MNQTKTAEENAQIWLLKLHETSPTTMETIYGRNF